MISKPTFAFFGTPDRAVIALNVLKSHGLVPSLIVTQPDRPQGRKLVMTSPAVKIWADKEHIPCIQPNDVSHPDVMTTLKKGAFDVFVVVAYGKILKQDILDIPTHGSLNLHASLLPLLRGSCPIETAILNDMRETGTTIIRMDDKMDHGPIILQKKANLPLWPVSADALATTLVTEGGELLAEAIVGVVNGSLKPIEQDHSKATYTKKIVKEDGYIDISADPYKNWLAYNAYKGWPGSFFFTEHEGKKTRITITEAVFEHNQFSIKKVIPEGKKEIAWKSAL